MTGETSFQPTEAWPLQEVYKRQLHAQIQKWGERVIPVLLDQPREQHEEREEFFEFLMTSVERSDAHTANIVSDLDGYAREYLEGPGPYGRGGGSINSIAGYNMCQRQFEGLFAIFSAGKLSSA